MREVLPFLMFEGRAAEAMSFYVSVFPDSAIELDQRYGAEGPGPLGTVAMGIFRIGAQRVRCTDSFVHHQFTFTPSWSLFVECGSEEEIERIFAKLAEEGGILMPLGAYPFSRKFGWVADRFGVSWQLSLP